MNWLRGHWLRLLAYFTGFFAAAIALWIDRMFGSPSIDQILYHLRYVEGAALDMSEVFLITFAVEVLGASVALAGVATVVHATLARKDCVWSALALRAAPHLTVAAGMAVLLLQFSAFSYAAAHFEEDRFGSSYRDPSTATLTEVQRRNLVLIYVESLEETYGDAALFGADLLAPLRSLGGQSLPEYRPVPGATWTIAGIVATQCGVPLAVYSEGEIRRKGNQRTFLPGATCLGDILQSRGYRNVFLGGAPLSFAGKGAFLQDHGYQERYGREEWLAAGARPHGTPDPELGMWGMFDDTLLARARQKLAALEAAGQPFNLTILTLDTHNPYGYASPDCRRRSGGGNRKLAFGEIVACTSRQVAEFVRFVRDRGYLQNTTVVVVGDHLAVGNPLDAQLRSVADRRRIFNLFLGTEPFAPAAGPVVPFDLFPTLLEATGMRTEDGRLGLGRSAWAPHVERAEWVQRPNAPALSSSPVYRRLWEATSPQGG